MRFPDIKLNYSYPKVFDENVSFFIHNSICLAHWDMDLLVYFIFVDPDL